jgi:uncharacterized protein (DUF885 family)
MKRVAICAAAVLIMSCQATPPKPSSSSASSSGSPGADFEKLSADFTYGTLALSPSSATQAGYHEHNGRSLDDALDDYSAAGLDQQRQFLAGIEARIAALNAGALDREQQADLQIIRNNVGLARLELDTIQSFRHNPTVYVELAGNALYTHYVLHYAPAEQRFQHIIKRLEQLPALFAGPGDRQAA